MVGVSVDSAFSHLAWVSQPRKAGGLGGLSYPLLSDITKSIAKDYDVLIEEGELEEGGGRGGGAVDRRPAASVPPGRATQPAGQPPARAAPLHARAHPPAAPSAGENAGVALRGLFLISPSGVLRQKTVNDLPVGRSVDETLRLVQAFQFADEHGEVCPAGWTPGAATIVPEVAASKKYFEAAAAADGAGGGKKRKA